MLKPDDVQDEEKKKFENNKIEEVCCGENFSIARTSNGELLVWGSNLQF
jgi:alpha-tubulin suppressor-like RCC1 family protein